MLLFEEEREIPVHAKGWTVHAIVQARWHRDSSTVVRCVRGTAITIGACSSAMAEPKDMWIGDEGVTSWDDADSKIAAIRFAVEKADIWFHYVKTNVRLTDGYIAKHVSEASR